MSLKATESGKPFRYDTGTDLSSNTALALKFTNPAGTEITVANPRVTAPAVNIIVTVDGASVTFNGNEYMEFFTNATDFVTSGTWKVCGIYTNTGASPNPEVWHGDLVSFIVGEAC
jgi:hypothetical protein